MTDKKTPLATEPVKNTESPKSTVSTKNTESQKSTRPSKSTTSGKNKTTPVPNTKVKDSAVKKSPEKEVPIEETKENGKAKVSKLAIIAIIIAIILTIIHYFWQQQQNLLLTIKLTEKIESKNAATLNQYQSQIKQVLNQQQKAFTQQLRQATAQVNNNNQVKISELDDAIGQLEYKVAQRQPSDWLLHEAEYLIRIAARTVWLEQDTTAAIGLLKSADTRLGDLNDPIFLPVRELVHQDIKSLELMPTLQTDEIILTLMAMNKQVALLPLAMVDVGAKVTSKELSNDINDWKENLTKTWEKFLDDFIRVRQRTGMIKPLVSPKQQQNLRQNLNLKVQLALWSASERKGDIYQESLNDIQQWITEFFDLKDATNQRFLQSVIELRTKRASYNYPNGLQSLSAIRVALRNQTQPPTPALPNKQGSVVKEAPKVKQENVVKAESKKIAPSPKPQEKTKAVSDKIKAEAKKIAPSSKPSEETKAAPAQKKLDAVSDKVKVEAKKIVPSPKPQEETKAAPAQKKLDAVSDKVKVEATKIAPSPKPQEETKAAPTQKKLDAVSDAVKTELEKASPLPKDSKPKDEDVI